MGAGRSVMNHARNGKKMIDLAGGEYVNTYYKIAMYLRLSKEDGEQSDESNSITNQRLLLKEYIRTNFKQYEWKEFSDDGYSGTNFLRPGVTEMLEQIQNGKINCVIVKDFSRFSRDYMELGSYLDQIFPFLGVRFISLNDGYDSAEHSGSTTGLSVSFKGLLYDLYTKDLSVKVKSSLHIRKEQGQYACANVSFGYARAKEDRHRLVIAEDEAKIVRRIFSLTLEGRTSSEIAKLFNLEKVWTPIMFKIEKGQVSRTPLGTTFQWDHRMICKILKNPVYTGDMAYEKYDSEEVCGKNRLKPRDEWKIFKDHHAAIVSREDFEKVQKRRKQVGRNKQRDGRQSYPLQGKVLCGGCKRAMTLRKRGSHSYFYCSQRYVYAGTETCVCNVNLLLLEQMIFREIGANLSVQKYLKGVRKREEMELLEQMDHLKKEKTKLEREKATCLRKRMKDYERFVFDDEYRFCTEDTSISQMEQRIRKVEQEVDRLQIVLSTYEEDSADFFGYKKDSAVFSREGRMAEPVMKLIAPIIRNIVVYDKENPEIEWDYSALTSNTEPVRSSN